MTIVLPPLIENAPGLKWRKIKTGWVAVWRARSDLVRRGYTFKSLRIWESTKTNPEPDATSKDYIRDRCQSLQDEMLAWGRGIVPQIMNAYVGTWRSLIACYQTDPDSPYHKKEWATRRHYDGLCRRIERECGDENIADMDARRLLRLYERIIQPDNPGDPPKISMGHAVIGMMRNITTFGATLLKCPACRAIRSDLSDMRIPAGKPREQIMTLEEIETVISIANTDGFHSIALANALEFDAASGVRQKDIIGEFVPLSEPFVSDVIVGSMKWVKGIRGEEIDDNLIWRHVTSKRKKLLVVNLRLAPLVMDEFRRMAGLPPDAQVLRHHIPAKGPLIISELTGLPWEASAFRREWRKIARKANLPDNVQNRDNRASGATESFQSGARPDAIQKGLNHATPAMTARYNRADEIAIEHVMEKRAEHRKNKTGTK